MFDGNETDCCEFMRVVRLEYSEYEKLVKDEITNDPELPRISMMLSSYNFV